MGHNEIRSDMISMQFTLVNNKFALNISHEHNRIRGLAPLAPHARKSAAGSTSSELVMFGGCLSGTQVVGPCPSRDSWRFNYETRCARCFKVLLFLFFFSFGHPHHAVSVC